MTDPRQIVLRPVITEKSVSEIRQGKYTFVVADKANKTQIKLAVEQMFNVTVKKVNTMRRRGKLRRMGRFEGYRPSFKRAIVTVEEGQTIKAFEGMM